MQKLKNFKQMLEMRHAITSIARISKRHTPNIDGTIILQLTLNVAKTVQWPVLVNAGTNHRFSIKDGEFHH
jgi:hypothetical protein